MIEKITMISVLSLSVALPLVAIKSKIKIGCASFAVCVLSSVFIANLILFSVDPDRHIGPTYGLSILMYLVISSIFVVMIFGIAQMFNNK